MYSSLSTHATRMIDGLDYVLMSSKLRLMLYHSTLMFIDAEARMDTYEDKDGVRRTQLNLLMRTLSFDPGNDGTAELT